MHLTDQDLIDTDRLSENEALAKHLSSCDDCQARQANLVDFRKKLASDKVLVNSEKQWQSIRQGLIATKNQQQQNELKSKIRRLQYGLFAVAASVIVVLVLPYSGSFFQQDSIPPPKYAANQQLTLELNKIIDENNHMQEIAFDLSNKNYILVAANKNLQLKLNLIDNQIQRAYLEKAPLDSKILMWKERLRILESASQASSSQKVRTI